MTFEEEFPSLMGCTCDCDGCDAERPCKSVFFDFPYSVRQEDIQKHCLDKQRVKEAIDEIHISHRVSVGDLKLIQKELRERLGL